MARVRLTQRHAGNDSREAAAPPASYDWQPEHPAYKADPEVDDYLIDNDGNGTGSEPADFAEDVHPGPYENSKEPANPHEERDHPAQPAGKLAATRRRAAEKKAAKCIRIAQAMLGPGATVAQIEDQAVDLMDLNDANIENALERLSATYTADQNDPDGDTLNPGHTLDGHPAILASPEEAFQAQQAEMAHAEGVAENGEKAAANFLADDEMSVEDKAAEELLAAMLAEEAPVEEAVEPEACGDEAEAEMPIMADEDEACGDDDLGAMLAPEGDPMGLGDEEASDDELLAELFAGRMAADDEEADEDEADDEEADDEEAGKKASDDEEADEDEADDEEADEDEADDEEAGKKAASTKQRPKARKASKGAKTLGAVTKAAGSEIADLSNLWETAPDVTDVFGS